MSQAFYRKWRPQTWDEVFAQDHVIQTLRNAVRTGRVGHAYLMAGPRGTGKTTTARLLAKALNCLAEDPAARPCDKCAHCQALNAGRFLDLIEIDAASNTSVDDVRDLRDKINFSPTQGRYKVYIIDEVHMLSTAAFNALLKTLEEPPPHAIFILATTEVHKIPATVLSRCQRYEFRRIPVPDIIRQLKEIIKEEKLKVDEDALTLIARQATGAMRDAISLLDQLASTGERVTLAEAQIVLGTATNSLVLDLMNSLLDQDAAAGLTTIQAALDSGTDARQFARQVVDYLRNLLLVRMGNADQVDATAEMRQEMAGHAARVETAHLLEMVRAFNTAAVDSRSAWHPGLALELALTESFIEKAAPAQEAAQMERIPVAAAAKTQPVAKTQPDNQQPVSRPPVPQSAGPAKKPIPEDDFDFPPEPEGPPIDESYTPGPARQTPAGKPAVQQPKTSTPQQPPAQRPPAGQPAASANRSAPKPQPTGQASGTRPAQPPEAPAAPGKAAGNTAENSGSITQHDVQENWTRIRLKVKSENALSAAALNSCRSFILKGDILILGFQSEVVKSKMETEENIKILRKALQSILGVTLGIRCIVTGSRSNQASDLDVDGDGIVGTALDLGGKIVYEE